MLNLRLIKRLIIACASAGLSAQVMAQDLTTGVEVNIVYDEQSLDPDDRWDAAGRVLRYTSHRHDAHPRLAYVTEIAYDAPARQNGLEVGDLLIAVRGESIVPDTVIGLSGIFGGSREERWIEGQGLSAGDDFEVMVARESGDVSIQIEVYQEPGFQSEHRDLLGAGGPPRRENGGFGTSWDRWYGELLTELGQIKSFNGWTNSGFRNLGSLQSLDRHKERLAFLVQNHPGPLANAIRDEWVSARNYVIGPSINVSDEDVSYRDKSDLVSDLSSVAQDEIETAKERFETYQGAMSFLPLPEEFTDEFDSLTSQKLYFEVTDPGALVSEDDAEYLVIGDNESGYFAVQLLGDEAAQGFSEARSRYLELTDQEIGPAFWIAGEVSENTEFLEIAGDFHSVVIVQPEYIASENGFGFDVSADTNPARTFAGEASVSANQLTDPEDNASPKEVMEFFIQAVKQGDEEAWRSVIAPWVIHRPQGSADVFLTDEETLQGSTLNSVASRSWRMSQSNFERYTYHVTVDKVGPIKQIAPMDNGQVSADDILGISPRAGSSTGPVIEEAWVAVWHIGKSANGTYLIEKERSNTRHWRLQRIDGGPWRICLLERYDGNFFTDGGLKSL